MNLEMKPICRGMTRWRRSLAWTLVMGFLLFVVPGCPKVGPEYERPEMPYDVPGGYQHANNEDTLWADSGDEWWEMFNDPVLSGLVDKVRRNNLDVLKAASQVLLLKAQFIQARSERFPSLDYQVKQEKGAKTSSSTTITGTGANGFGFTIQEERVETDALSVTLPITYELDLWGKTGPGHGSGPGGSFGGRGKSSDRDSGHDRRGFDQIL